MSQAIESKYGWTPGVWYVFSFRHSRLSALNDDRILARVCGPLCEYEEHILDESEDFVVLEQADSSRIVIRLSHYSDIAFRLATSEEKTAKGITD